MKKPWIIVLAVAVMLLLAGGLWRLRPGPQVQLWKAVKSMDSAAIQSAMAQGAEATLPITEWPNALNYTPGHIPLGIYLSDTVGLSGFAGQEQMGESVQTLQAMLRKADLRVQYPTHRLIELDNKDGLLSTPLHHVALLANEHPEKETRAKTYLQLLLKNGAPVNAKAKEPAGVTPLMLAREKWVVELLLKAGADPNLVAANGACIMNFNGQEPTSNAVWKLLKKYKGRPRRVPDTLDFPRPIFGRDKNSIEGWKNGRQ